MRRLVMSFLVLAATTACADDPMTPGPPESGRPLAQIIRSGGLDDFANDGEIPFEWPQFGWGIPFGFVPPGEECLTNGLCAVGRAVTKLGNLEAPESPYAVFLGAFDVGRFGYIATQGFYLDVESDDPNESNLTPATVLASGIETAFSLPTTGSWALSLDYAVLAAGGPVSPGHDDVARVLLVKGADIDATLGDVIATPLEVHRSELSGGGCGTLELPRPREFDGPSTSATYDDCTGWQRLQFDLSDWAGEELTLRLRAEEVGDDDGNPIALAFDNVQVIETFTREAGAGAAITLAVTPPIVPTFGGGTREVEFETFEWMIDAGCTLSSSSDPTPIATCSAPGTFEVRARMSEAFDPIAYYALGTLIVTDPNTPPVVDEVAGPTDPVRLGDPVTVTASFIDPDMDDVHTTTVDWGDGTSTSLTVAAGARTATAMHNYVEPGIYPVEVTVADAGSDDAGRFESVVIIDPDGGFVAGGGWFYSPAGAFRDHPELTGRLTVAFAARYHRHRSVPQGHTLVLRSFKFLFRSRSYEWLVVADGTAQYQGTGTVNGKGDYGFLVAAVDGGRSWHSEDHFKIKVWDRNDGDRVVYDNAMPVGGGGPSTLLRGGTIVVHE